MLIQLPTNGYRGVSPSLLFLTSPLLPTLERIVLQSLPLFGILLYTALDPTDVMSKQAVILRSSQIFPLWARAVQLVSALHALTQLSR